jgi:hypothetical protein
MLIPPPSKMPLESTAPAVSSPRAVAVTSTQEDDYDFAEMSPQPPDPQDLQIAQMWHKVNSRSCGECANFCILILRINLTDQRHGSSSR